MYICSHTHHVNHTVLARENILLVVTSADIRHDRNLHIRVVVSDYLTDSCLITELPFAEFIYIKKLLRCFITKLHIVDACLYVCTIKSIDKIICKHKVVYQSSIPNGSVKHADIRACCH